jgi:hypothetical protein
MFLFGRAAKDYRIGEQKQLKLTNKIMEFAKNCGIGGQNYGIGEQKTCACLCWCV